MKNEKLSKKQIGLRLKEFRLSLGMTQQQFSDKLYWDINTYRKIETGVSMLTSDKAQQLHEYFNADISYLLLGEKQDARDMLKRVWISATPEERKRLYEEMMKCIHEVM